MARYFFDSSALAKRYHPETGSVEVDRLFTEPSREVLISRLSFVEIQSVFAMKVRGGFLTIEEGVMQSARLKADVASGEIEVRSMTASHFAAAEQLIGRYGYAYRLRTLDALQLAVAVSLVTEGLVDEFVVADKVLRDVAALEGIPVLNPEG